MDEAWQRARAVYAMLERNGAAGVHDDASLGRFRPALTKVWHANHPVVWRAWDVERQQYVYVLQKYWDGRYETWLTSDGERADLSLRTSSSGSSDSPTSQDGNESTCSPKKSDATGPSTSPSPPSA